MRMLLEWTQRELDCAYSRYMHAKNKARKLPAYSIERDVAESKATNLFSEWAEMVDQNNRRVTK